MSGGAGTGAGAEPEYVFCFYKRRLTAEPGGVKLRPLPSTLFSHLPRLHLTHQLQGYRSLEEVQREFLAAQTHAARPRPSPRRVLILRQEDWSRDKEGPAV